MNWDDWLLALHLLSAAAYGSAIILFWALIVAIRKTDTADETLRMGPMVKVGTVFVGIGVAGTIIFGIWLALSVRNYDIWDGWIIAAIVLWAIAGATGGRAGKEYERGMHKAQELQAAGQAGASPELVTVNRTQAGVLFHAISTLAFVLIVIDMVWKPGA